MNPQNPSSMQRYRVDSIAFSEDLGSILVRFADLGSAGGPILSETKEQEISLMGDDDSDMRQQIAEIVDYVCDILDRAHADRRKARP